MKTWLGSVVETLRTLSGSHERGRRSQRAKYMANRALLMDLESRLLLSVNHAGDLDTTFNTSGTTPGVLEASFPGTGNTISQPLGFSAYPTLIRTAFDTTSGSINNGKMVMADSTSGQVVVSRYLPDAGAQVLDPTFDPTNVTPGTPITIDFGAYGTGRTEAVGGVAIQPDGKIIIAGTIANATDSFDVNAFVIRLNSNGSMDTTFDSEGRIDGRAHDGIVIYDFANGQEHVNSVLVQSNGKIVVGGYTSVDPTTHYTLMFLTRFNTDGSVDNTFGADGRTTTSVGGSPIFVGGDHPFYATNDDEITCMALQSDGSIVVGGTAYTNGSEPTDTQFLLARYSADGVLDTTFGTGGITTTDISPPSATFGWGDDGVDSLVIQPDGKIVVSGYSAQIYGMNPALKTPWAGRPETKGVVARYTTSGTLDNTFGAGGIFAAYLATNNLSGTILVYGTEFTQVALQSDGKIVVTGPAQSGNGMGFGTARLTTDGVFDPSFGTAGRTLTRIDTTTTGLAIIAGDPTANPAVLDITVPIGAEDVPFGLYINPTGKITVAGASMTTAFSQGVAPKAPKATSYLPIPATITIGQFEMVRYTNDTPLYPSDTVAPQAALWDATTNDSAPAPVTVAGGTTYTFRVLYTDNWAINSASIQNNISYITVTGPNGYSVTPSGVTLSTGGYNSPIIATYTIAAPLGGWVIGDNGTYNINLAQNAVVDAENNPVVAGVLGSFTVNIPKAHTPPTAAALQPQNVTSTGGTTYQFKVQYQGTPAINVSTLLANSNVVHVTGPNGYDQYASFVSIDSPIDGSPRTVTYQITPPGGSWSLADQATYSILIDANKVADTSTALPTDPNASFVAAGPIGQFTVLIPDTTAPTASLIQPANITNTNGAGTATFSFQVVYSDNVAVKYSTIGSGNVTVTGPTGTAQAATLVRVDVPGDGTPRTATYSIPAPGGAWDSTSDGTYTITMVGNQVSDTSANFVAAGVLGTFKNTVVFSDSTPPTAVATAPTISSNTNSETISVTYSDNVAINVGSLANTNLLVTGPNGFSRNASFVAVDQNTSGTPRVATYTLTTGTGSWTPAYLGSYIISMVASQVDDTSGNYVAAGSIGAFTVTIGSTPLAVATGPTVSSAGGTTETITVTYTDTVAVNVATLGNGNILVTGPNGYSQAATLVSANPTNNGSPIVATYTVPAANGLWDSRADGTYTINMQAGQVFNTRGNSVDTGAIGTFQIAVPYTLVADLNALDFAGVRTGVYTFTIDYTDQAGLNVNSIINNNMAVTVTGPLGFRTFAKFVSIDANAGAATRRVTYSLLGPGSTWNTAAAGAYHVAIQPNQISDLSGNQMAATQLGVFYYSPTPFFNERFYLTNNPDIALGVSEGLIPSGYAHFVNEGKFEGRNPSIFFNQAYYLQQNPDIAVGVAEHMLPSAWDHFIGIGYSERRKSSAYFDEAFYDSQHPEVVAAVHSGAIPSALWHFIQLGMAQGYDPSPLISNTYYYLQYPDVQQLVNNGNIPSALVHFFTTNINQNLDRTASPFFDRSIYLTNNADIAAGVANGMIKSAFEHFIYAGINEARIASNKFDANYYVNTYSDIRLGIAEGFIPSALSHYLAIGMVEARNPSANFDEAFYLANNPDVVQAIAQGLFRSGYEQYLLYGQAQGRLPHP